MGRPGRRRGSTNAPGLRARRGRAGRTPAGALAHGRVPEPLPSLSDELKNLKLQNAYRSRQVVQGPQDIEIQIDGKRYISFSSNDYLGLANDQRVCDAAVAAIRHYGVGSGASQLISGYSSLHCELEQQLAEFLNFPRCVLFSSGYLANLGVISSFASKHSIVIQDKLNHASLIDAAKYAGIKLKRYRHRDIEHAKKLLASENQSSKLIATDGVFSMEGSIAPLKQLAQIKQNILIVDDAHGIGVLGKHGKGSIEQQQVSSSKVDILIGTFGKSFGASGAFVLSSDDRIEYLIQKARTLTYTTSLPTAVAAAAKKSLEIIINEPQRRQRLHDNISYFRLCASQTSLNLLDSMTAIQSLIIGENDKALEYSRDLKNKGFLVIAIRPPTVPKNTSRLRITLSSEHTHQHIDQLISALLEIENLQR